MILEKCINKQIYLLTFGLKPLDEIFIGLWLNQPSTVIGLGVSTFVFLGIYLKLHDIYINSFFLINGILGTLPKN